MNEYTYNIVNSNRIKEISTLKNEVFLVLYACGNTLKGNINYDCVGTKDNVLLPDVNLVISNCQALNTRSIILVHNHPYYRRTLSTLFSKYCDSEPSITDIASTRAFGNLAKEQGIDVLDHIIVCPDGSYFSFSQNGLI